MGKRYKNSPIIEAVCEFRFEPGQPWDLTIPGLLYERVRHDFPLRRQAPQFHFSLAPGPEECKGQVQPTGRMQFYSNDEKSLVQVGRDLLAVNRLKPYPTWQEFTPQIREAFDAYCEVANPNGIRRIGLRYINLIGVPGDRIEPEQYFHFRPFLGTHLPAEFASFIVGFEVLYEDSRDRLRLQLSTAASEKPSVTAIMLDLDYFLAQPGKVQVAACFDWLEIAHARTEEMFEASITDRLRALFEEVNE